VGRDRFSVENLGRGPKKIENHCHSVYHSACRAEQVHKYCRKSSVKCDTCHTVKKKFPLISVYKRGLTERRIGVTFVRLRANTSKIAYLHLRLNQRDHYLHYFFMVIIFDFFHLELDNQSRF